jgi:pyruvate formate lyase activating enzyme
MSKEAIDMIAPFLDAANVDLKCFSDDTYKKVCKGSLGPVLDSIGYMKKKGIWVEVTTLVVPGMNDSERELSAVASFISSVDPDMPWHISRFNPDHERTSSCPTPIETMRKAYEIGKEENLKYVYLGNVQEGSDTECPGCGATLVTRYGYRSVPRDTLDARGKCKKCGSTISGVWR